MRFLWNLLLDCLFGAEDDAPVDWPSTSRPEGEDAWQTLYEDKQP